MGAGGDNKVLLLDGGMGHLLKQRGVETTVEGLPFDQRFLAVAIANGEAPDAVAAAHEEFIAAGADVITTNNFSVTPWSLARVQRAHLLEGLTRAAGELARHAADAAGRGTLVAGCLPPLGDCYTPSLSLGGFEASQPQYAAIAALLAPFVDLFLCETHASIEEGLAAASEASLSGKPFWVSWTLWELADPDALLLRSGEQLKDAVAAVSRLPGLQALLVNCCAPQVVAAALPVLRDCAPPGVRVGGYANGFRTTTSQWLLAQGGQGPGPDALLTTPADDYDEDGAIKPTAFAQHAIQWVNAGAEVVGGCCGVGPAAIAAVRERLGK